MKQTIGCQNVRWKYMKTSEEDAPGVMSKQTSQSEKDGKTNNCNPTAQKQKRSKKREKSVDEDSLKNESDTDESSENNFVLFSDMYYYREDDVLTRTETNDENISWDDGRVAPDVLTKKTSQSEQDRKTNRTGRPTAEN